MATILQFDEINRLAEEIYTRTASLPAERRKQEICDEIEDLLIIAYAFGQERVYEAAGIPSDQAVRRPGGRRGEQVPDTLPVPEIPQSSSEDVYRAIYKPVAGETFEERIERRIEEKTLDLPALQRIVETEYHRVEETGAYDTAFIVANATKRKPYKAWKTMLDERVRSTHVYLEGAEVPIDDLFFTYDGDCAMFPGDFSDPENNCGCRCWLSYTFR